MFLVGILVTQNKVLFQDGDGGGPSHSELTPFTQLTTICQFTSPALPHTTGLGRIPLRRRVLAWTQVPSTAPEEASPATQPIYIKYEQKTRDHQLYEKKSSIFILNQIEKEEPEEIDTTQETEKHLEIILPRGASLVAQG